MPLLIVRNDITEMKADAIVNTANPLPMVGSGVDRAIYKKAGWMELLRIRMKIGKLGVGDVAVTPALKIEDTKYIIHIVGPRWKDGNHREAEMLACCYQRVLETASKYGCESVAIPLISTGNFKFPKELALRIARKVITEYIDSNELLVYLVVYDEDSFKISRDLFQDVKSYINEKIEYTPKFCICVCKEKGAPLKKARNEADKFVLVDNSKPKGRSLKDLVEELDSSFSETLFKHIDNKGLTDPMVYKRANLSRKLFSKIRANDDYQPSKNTALALAVALELNLDETKDFIGKAGYAISHTSKFDIIVEYFIIHGIYDIDKLNETLFAFDQPLLGSNVT